MVFPFPQVGYVIVSWRVVLGSVFFVVEIMAPKRELVRGITLNSKLLQVEMKKTHGDFGFSKCFKNLKRWVFTSVDMYHRYYYATFA